jgi:hypothetical protein
VWFVSKYVKQRPLPSYEIGNANDIEHAIAAGGEMNESPEESLPGPQEDGFAN